MTCIYQDKDGRWRRGVLHLWRKFIYTKRCVRCGVTKDRVF